MYSLRPYTLPLKRFKNGKLRLPSKTKYKWFLEPHRAIKKFTEGEYQPVKLKQFEPGSRDKIKLWLKRDLDFEFTTYTEKGSAKVDIVAITGMIEELGNRIDKM